MSRLRKDFRRDESGTIAIYTAIIAIPLLMAVTYAMDVKWAESNRTGIKSAADFAVLAAVNNNALSASEKADFAVEVFRTNYEGRGEPSFSVEADGSSVRMMVDATFPATVTQMVGLNDMDVRVASRAELTTEQIICVLALNPTANGAISFQGDVDFSAPTCSVYANSSSSQAIQSSGRTTPTAKGFCAVGGVRGNFSPFGNSQCRVMDDPYRDDFAPAIGACSTDAAIIRVFEDVLPLDPLTRLPVELGNDPGGRSPDSLPRTTQRALIDTQEGGPSVGPEGFLLVPMPDGSLLELAPTDSLNVVPDNTTLASGSTYCGGLTIAGRNVRMQAGEHYVLDGPFVVKDEARVTGSEVIVALGGVGADFRVEDDGSLDLSAPKVGAHKGIVIMEDVRNREGALSGNATRRSSKIMSGGELSVTGTVYLPGHALEIRGNGSRVGARAPSTSFIADTVLFQGTGVVTVAVDHEQAGLPPILPRSEDGARLTE